MLKSNQFLIFLCLLISTSVIVTLVTAHTPLNPSEEIHSLDTAFEIPNPTKSWTLYRELHHEGEAEYFKLHLNSGERLRANLYIKEINENFSPNLIIIGPDMSDTNLLPVFIEIPEGFGASLIESLIPEKPEYEPFTPASYYYLVDVDLNISTEADYYVIVYEPNLEEGKYGIAIGYKEEFTISEWLLIPLDVIGIHQWEGQSLLLIMAPLLLSLFFGFLLLAWKSLIKLDIFNIIGISAGLIYVGSGLMLLTQMLLALIGSTYDSLIIVTLVFVALPMVLGFVLVKKIVLFKGQLSTVDRIVLVILGLAGFFTWSGLLLGPTLVIIISLLPNQVFQKRDK